MKFIQIIRKKPIISGIVIVVIIVLISIIVSSTNGAEQQTMIIHRADFINEISVSGKVIAAETAELGFDQSGRISSIKAQVGDNVKAGQTIASIENAGIYAEIAQREAALERETAKLAALNRGTRVEELAVYEQTYADTSSALVIAMRDAYLQTENAIIGKVDTIFTNGNLSNPEINVRTQSYNEKRSIENERLVVGEKIEKWKSELSKLTPTSPSETILSVRTVGNDAISSTKVFIDHLLYITGNLSPANSGILQTQIDTYRATINAAGQQAATAASAEQTAYSAWTSASSSLRLQKSGSTAEDLAAQVAQVKSAEADLNNARAQFRKTVIVAPFDGIITKMDLKIGEISSPNSSEIAIMSPGIFEIESYIPEINIARVKINDPAIVTLDAYGSTVNFSATVTAIDPAETLKDGVSTYKTRLRFTDNDPRIKSGMTANIRIIAEKKADAITIPQSIISERDGRKFVQVIFGGAISDVEVTTGSATALGQTEIISGLNEGDEVVLPPLTTP